MQTAHSGNSVCHTAQLYDTLQYVLCMWSCWRIQKHIMIYMHPNIQCTYWNTTNTSVFANNSPKFCLLLTLLTHLFCAIGIALVNTFANTSLKLCVLFTLHTAHCSHLFSKTLFALQTADTSLMQRCLSQYWLKFFQSAGQGCDCWPTRKICGKRFNRAGNFPRGGWVPPFAVHTFQKQNSSSPPPLKPSCFLQQAPATSQAPSQMPWGGKPFPERYYFHKKCFVHRSVWVWVGEVYGIESMIKGDSEKRDFVRKEIL